MFKKSTGIFIAILKVFRPELNLTYNIHNTEELKSFTRVDVGLSQLIPFSDMVFNNFCPICACGWHTTTHFPLHCSNN